MSERLAFAAAMILIAAVMRWRVGFALPDNLLAQWFVAAVVLYLVGRGWFWLCRRQPFAAIFLAGFLRGLFGRR